MRALLARDADPTHADVVAAPQEGRRGRLSVTDGRIAVGIGGGSAEDVRCAAAPVVARAKEMGARSIGWDGPEGAAFVEGAVLAAYEYTASRSQPPDEPSGPEEVLVREGAEAGLVAECVNFARDLQNAPANVLTPTELAARAQRIDGLQVEVWGRAQIEAAGMGGFAAVAAGSDQEPALITLRYFGGGDGATLGLVGKAVTFDTGGYSIKAAKGMWAMQYDMSGGAAVLGAMKAIAALELPIDIVAVVGATENLVSGSAMKPGDVVRARNGTTIEILNTDAEGRLVLCDCITHAIDQGAERVIDIATLTGGIVTTFGKGHAGLMGTDDALCDLVRDCGERTGERVWRLPLDAFYDDMIKGQFADIANAVESRHAHSITAGQFLARFAGDVPWAHLDIAGVADDNGRPYTPKGGAGWGVRLLVEVARMAAAWTSTSQTTTN